MTNIKEKYLAIDIGGTKISVSLFNDQGFISRNKAKTKLSGNQETIPLQIIDLAKELCKKNTINLEDIAGVGVSTCGPFLFENGKLCLVGPNLCGSLSTRNSHKNNWRNIPLEEVLKRYFDNLNIQNDCIASAKAEKIFGLGQNKNDFIYITWSTGIGSGAYVNNKLILGKNNNAPHIGHILVKENSKNECGCGMYGHLEGEVSGSALEKRYGKPSAELFADYRKKDEKAIKLVHEVVQTFSLGLASINTILDNKLFILGGSVFENNQDILLPLLRKEFAKQAYAPLAIDVEIKASKLGKHIADYGAASLIMPEEYYDLWKKNIN